MNDLNFELKLYKSGCLRFLHIRPDKRLEGFVCIPSKCGIKHIIKEVLKLVYVAQNNVSYTDVIYPQQSVVQHKWFSKTLS